MGFALLILVIGVIFAWFWQPVKRSGSFDDRSAPAAAWSAARSFETRILGTQSFELEEVTKDHPESVWLKRIQDDSVVSTASEQHVFVF